MHFRYPTYCPIRGWLRTFKNIQDERIAITAAITLTHRGCSWLIKR